MGPRLAAARESYDGEVYAFLGFVSGHTLKRLLATVGAGWLARMIVLREPAGGAELEARATLPT